MARVEQRDHTVLSATQTCSGLNALTELKPRPPVFMGPQKQLTEKKCFCLQLFLT